MDLKHPNRNIAIFGYCGVGQVKYISRDALSHNFYLYIMESSGEKVETRFNSITPLIIKLRDLIFGERKPDLYTRIAVYLNLIIWFVFFVWHLIGYTAISLREMIYVKKKINVEELIFQRGEALGFRPYEFLNLLMKYHLISVVCWAGIFIGIVFMWRKKRIYAVFLLGSLAVYVIQLLFFMGWNYFMLDTTVFDKILLVVLALNSLLYLFLMPRSFYPDFDSSI